MKWGTDLGNRWESVSECGVRCEWHTSAKKKQINFSLFFIVFHLCVSVCVGVGKSYTNTERERMLEQSSLTVLVHFGNVWDKETLLSIELISVTWVFETNPGKNLQRIVCVSLPHLYLFSWRLAYQIWDEFPDKKKLIKQIAWCSNSLHSREEWEDDYEDVRPWGWESEEWRLPSAKNTIQHSD